MTRKRYHYNDETLTEDLANDGVSIQDPTADYSEELYSRVGVRFPVTWEAKSRAEPIIDTEDLPDSVSGADVESALTDMKNEGVL